VFAAAWVGSHSEYQYPFQMAQENIVHPEWVQELLEDDKNDKKQGKASSPVKKDADQKTVDAFLAKELNELSIQDREQVYEELHGVDQVIEETPKFVEEKLEALDQELASIPDKAVYEQAKQTSKDYVTSREFRLMFLRADYFDPKKAAARLVWFMEKKLQFFGPNSLGRPLMLKDLDEDDRQALEAGHLQLLANRDRAGRVVLCDLQNLFPRCYKYGINQVNASFIL
jgi:hypothetical protein